MSDYIESLKWRYATKKYDPTRKVSADDLEKLKQAVQLSVSSMGLQPYRIFIISDPEVRAKLAPAAYNQDGITNASHVFVFAYEANVGEEQIEAYLNNIAAERGIARDDLKGMEDMLYGTVNRMDEDAKNNWAAKQAYIALSSLINAAATLRIDATPMEGFDPAAVNQVLSLADRGLGVAAIATVGYRHEDDRFQHFKKVRKPDSQLFINL